MQSSTVAALSWSRNGFRSVGLLVASRRFFKTSYNLGFVLCVWGYLCWFRVNNVRYSSYMATAKFSIIQHEGKNSWLSFARSKAIPSPRLRCKHILYFFFSRSYSYWVFCLQKEMRRLKYPAAECFLDLMQYRSTLTLAFCFCCQQRF